VQAGPQRRRRRSGSPRSPGPLRRLLLCKRRTTQYKLKILAEPPLYGEVPKTCKKETGSKADMHISGTMAHTSTIPARRPSTTQTARWPTTGGFTFFSSEGQGRRRGRTAWTTAEAPPPPFSFSFSSLLLLRGLPCNHHCIIIIIISSSQKIL
jgi:hypothetical protein